MQSKIFTLKILLRKKKIFHTTYVQHVIVLLELFFKEFVVQIANTYIHYIYNMTRHLRIYTMHAYYACVLEITYKLTLTRCIFDQNVQFSYCEKTFYLQTFEENLYLYLQSTCKYCKNNIEFHVCFKVCLPSFQIKFD